MDKWWIEVERIPLQRGYRLWLTYHDGEHRRVLVAAHEILDVEPDQIIDQATAVIPESAAQQLIDALWQTGLRPSEGTGSAGALAATQKHLDDMQRLVFEGRESIMGVLAWLKRDVVREENNAAEKVAMAAKERYRQQVVYEAFVGDESIEDMAKTVRRRMAEYHDG